MYRCILLSALVGQYTEYRRMNGVSNKVSLARSLADPINRQCYSFEIRRLTTGAGKSKHDAERRPECETHCEAPC